jgi:hypothetical protein
MRSLRPAEKDQDLLIGPGFLVPRVVWRKTSFFACSGDDFDGEWRAVGHENEQSGRGAERPTGDAVVTLPGAIAILGCFQPLGHPSIPLFPLFASLEDQRFTDIEEAEEFLAPVVTEACKEAGSRALRFKSACTAAFSRSKRSSSSSFRCASCRA